MELFHHHPRGGKRLRRRPKSERLLGARLAALLLGLSMLTGLLPAPARAAEEEAPLSGVVTFDSIALHYAGDNGLPEKEPIADGALIGKTRRLALRYTYTITPEQCRAIEADTPYYLTVSPHLVLPHLEGGSPLTVKTEEGTQERFGAIHADGARAWVVFDANSEGSGTVLSQYGELNNAYFYLNCTRAEEAPQGETPIGGTGNLYAMKFENNSQLTFGYAEREPVSARAQLRKDGGLTGKTITWTIDYTPWQNPSAADPVTLDTPFQLRDTIDASLHSYVEGSVTIDGAPVPDNGGGADAYVRTETSETATTLTFGGAKFNAGRATQGNPASPLKITYQTQINDELLLPGGAGGKSVTNAAELFAGEEGVFNSLHITAGKTVAIPQPTWLAKTGETHRDYPNGSYTDWTVTFQPNGFDFTGENSVTLHDRLPEGSSLVEDSVTVDGAAAAAAVEEGNLFTVSPITPAAKDRPVAIRYRTRVGEEMYDSGTSLGTNTAWFTLHYGGEEYETPQAARDVGSGDGSGTPGTAVLVKDHGQYDPASRTIDWTVTINPHKANLIGGTFTDDLAAVGPRCGHDGHTGGLELVNGTADVTVNINGRAPTDEEKALIGLSYDRQALTLTAGAVGTKTITLAYTARVCDPCVFANNGKATLNNTVSTTDMAIGSKTNQKASAGSEAPVDVTVLTKKAPVYDYASGLMTWTVEVDAAGLPMEGVVLTDDLPAGLTYVESSLAVSPGIPGASAGAAPSVEDPGRQTLTITLGAVTGKTTVTFATAVDPEVLGFGGDEAVVVENTVCINGSADGVPFAEVSHYVKQNFSNHGLVKTSRVDNQQELIRYEVLINPYRLALPENPALVDTLDKRLQLDPDTLLFYKASLTGTTAANGQKPEYAKVGAGQPLKAAAVDPAANSFTVRLPIGAEDRDAYVLAYTADIIDHQAGGYSNSVRFDGGSLLLGGGQDNSAAVGGGGGGGGGGLAARKATVSLVKTDQETGAPLSGVTFLLYQWDSENRTRGLPFARKATDARGKLSFLVKPGGVYQLVEEESLPGYGSKFGWTALPDGAEETEDGLLITAGAASSTLTLRLTNEAHTADIVFRLVNQSGIPMAGAKVEIFTSDPAGQDGPVPAKEAAVSPDGTVRFSGMRRGATYYIRRPGGGVMTVELPAQADGAPKALLPDGSWAALTADYQAAGVTEESQQWTLTAGKTAAGGTAPLAGAVIGLYADEACQMEIKTAVTGQDGTAAFSGLIKGQRYWLRETAAPSGYQLSAAIYEGTEDAPHVTIENAPLPDNPGTPGNSGSSGGSGSSGRPGTSGKPIDPSNPDAPGQLIDPSQPGTPGELIDPNAPDASGQPIDPNAPDASGQPIDPNAPDVSPVDPADPAESGPSGELPTELPDPNGPGAPNRITIREGGVLKTYRRVWDAKNEAWTYILDENVPLYGMDIPQTGDDTRLLAGAALASGIALAVMTVYRLLGLKKREKQ